MGGSPLTEPRHPASMVSSPLHVTSSLAESYVRSSAKTTTTDKNNNFLNPASFFDIPITSSSSSNNITVNNGTEVFRTPPREAPPTIKMDLASTTSSPQAQMPMVKPPQLRGHQRSQSTPSPPTFSKPTKSVGFDRIHVRRYSLVMGDHPCCNGIPVSLGWEYSPEEHNISIDEYEASRSPRRSREQLKLSSAERRDLLKLNKQISDSDLKRAERKLHRERSCQRKNHTKLCAAFFTQELPTTACDLQHLEEQQPQSCNSEAA